MTPSWQSRVASCYARLVIRRRDWGTGRQIAQRAQRVFGMPAPLSRVASWGLRVERVRAADGIRGEWVVPATPRRGVIMYIHGGGYLSCSAESHRPVIGALARAANCRVFGVDYRLAPDTSFPGAFDDVLSTYRWLLERGAPEEPVVLAGDSAGGGLALAVAAHLRQTDLPQPACVVALSPWTDLALTGESLVGNDGRCAMFRTENMPAFAAVYLDGAAADDPRVSPLYADVRGLAPVLMQVGTTELLRDDARRMHERIVRAGGSSRLTEYEDVMHGWHLLWPVVPEASRAIAEAAAFIGAWLPSTGDDSSQRLGE